MSRSYREWLEQFAPSIEDYRAWKEPEQRQAEQGQQQWLADQAAQAEYQSWLDTLRDERN